MNEFLNILLNNLVELVIAAVIGTITCFVIPWAKKTAAPFIQETVIPWLEERRLFGIVQHFVEAAEKYAENNHINKYDYVLDLLDQKNIAITPEIEAYIESAVKQLDMSVGQVVDIVTDPFTENEDDTEGRTIEAPENKE